MKILQVNAVNGILSTGRTCSEIANHLKENGDECITAYSTGIQTYGAYPVAPAIECKLHGLLSRLTGLQGYFSPVSTGNLIRLIKKTEPDVVHLRNLHANYISFNRLMKYLASNDIPTVITLHDCWVYTGKCTHYFSEGCYRWKTGCYNCPKLKDDHASWFFDRTKKMWADKKTAWTSIPRLAVVGVSDWITNEGKKSPMFANAKIIRRIYNWIDLDVFKPADGEDVRKRLGIGNKKMILGVASGWNNKKGLDKFIALSEKLYGDEVIVLVGNIPDMSLPDNIISVPPTADVNELIEYYSAADVFLQLSEQETFGKVVAESLACGTPVITNNRTANGELVDETCGIVLPKTDADSLRAGLDDIFGRDSVSMSDKCVNRAGACFSKNECIAQYTDLYSELIGR